MHYFLRIATVLIAVGPLLSSYAETIAIDRLADRKPISPEIYGVNFAGSSGELTDLNSPLHRSGGNAETNYNYQQNAFNTAMDWYFESLADGSPGVSGKANSFIDRSKVGGAQPMITIPMIGWVAKLGPSNQRLSSFSIAKYGAQDDADTQWFPDAGNGKRAGVPITGNDPNDAYVTSNEAFQRGFVQNLVSRWGSAQGGGVRYYILDNEPGLWHDTHRDVRPVAPHATELRDLYISYSAAVKAADPGALVAGPEEWGWPSFQYSPFDFQWLSQGRWGLTPPDQAALGYTEFLPWLLAQLKASDLANGRRTLDIFTVHYYPQGGETLNADVTAPIQTLRNRSTRELWDPSYVSESWVNAAVGLIPRIRGWVNNNYFPNTKIGITEYNWGAYDHMNGATAHADVLGIFGQTGLDLATIWVSPPVNSPAYNAFKIFRNYDGAKSTFGDISVRAVANNRDIVSAYAAERTGDGALTVVVINKSMAVQPIQLTVANHGQNNAVQLFQLSSVANSVRRIGNSAMSGATFSFQSPAQSVTLAVVSSGPAGPPDTTAPTAVAGAGATGGGRTVTLNWNANTESDLLGYFVDRTQPGARTRLTPVAISGRTFQDLGLQPNVQHCYQISAVDLSGNVGPGSSVVCATPTNPPPLPLYDDALRNGFGNWSYTGTYDFNSTVAYLGTRGIAATPGAWGGLSLGQNPPGVNISSYDRISLAIRPSQNNPPLQLNLNGGTTVDLNGYVSGGLKANQWNVITVPFADLGLTGTLLTGMQIFNAQPTPSQIFYVDAIELTNASVVADTTAPAAPSGFSQVGG